MSQINNSNKEAKLVLLFVMFFLLLALITIFFIVSERYIQKFFQHGQVVSLDAAGTINQEAEEKAMRAGLSRMIAGRIESIDKDQRSFVVNIDPYGDNKTYTILTANNTGYSMMYEDPIDPEAIDEEDFAGNIREPEMIETEFEFIEVGRSAEVHFAQRMDLDTASKLVAQKIVILPN